MAERVCDSDGRQRQGGLEMVA